MRLTSQAIITEQFVKTIEDLIALREQEEILLIATPQILEEGGEKRETLNGCRTIVTETRTFRIEDAKMAIEKAYITSEVGVVIILAAHEYSEAVQNKLLKIIEEPPSGVHFIVLVASKATLLPTIRSRLPLLSYHKVREAELFELDMRAIDLASVYEFVQKYKLLTDKATAKNLAQKMMAEAILCGSFQLDGKSLRLFGDAFRAIDVGTRPSFVFATLLMKLLARKKRS